MIVQFRLARGMATSIEDRQLLGIHGLLPPRCESIDILRKV